METDDIDCLSYKNISLSSLCLRGISREYPFMSPGAREYPTGYVLCGHALLGI